jgi:hypothetical protein
MDRPSDQHATSSRGTLLYLLAQAWDLRVELGIRRARHRPANTPAVSSVVGSLGKCDQGIGDLDVWYEVLSSTVQATTYAYAVARGPNGRTTMEDRCSEDLLS